MLSIEVTVFAAIAYLTILFSIAYRGDRAASNRVKPYRYALAQGVHCTSWAFFGTITQSAYYGWAFAPTYAGAIVVFILLHGIQLKLLNYCKHQNITSISDLIGTRYGKSPLLAGVVAITAFIAVVPYISLQLRAVTSSFAAVTGFDNEPFWLFDLSLLVALTMVVFGFLFGTRRLSLAEQHSGLMDAIAFESLVKLAAFIIVGLFASYSVFDGLTDLFQQSFQTAHTQDVLAGREHGGYVFAVHMLLGGLSMFCLPRQFHVGYVENTHSDELRTARWAFPLYLFAINFFILPLALSALHLAPGEASRDTFLLVIPLMMERPDITLIAFIGGLSAATSMVIIALLALSIMVSNDVVMPVWLRLTRQRLRQFSFTPKRILSIRRVTMIVVMFMAYLYYKATIESMPLVNSGLLSLALLAQMAPAILGTAVWRNATQSGVLAGLAVGTALWLTLLLIPSIGQQPQITDIDIADGVLISLGANLFCFWLFSIISRSVQTEPPRVDHAEEFAQQPSLSWARLRSLLSRFYDDQQLAAIQQRLQMDLLTPDGQSMVPAPMLVRIERELSAVIGTSASRLLLDTVSEQQEFPVSRVVDWATEASRLYQFNRELLQASVENIPQGISVVDQKLRLVAWNRRYLEIFAYPDGLVRSGMPVEELLRYNASRGLLSTSENQDVEGEIQKRLNYLRAGSAYRYQRQQGSLTIELQGNPMPGGGFVTTYSDITERIEAQKQLQKVNQELEQRVDERTQQLLSAKQAEERAHESKSRFFVAVSHDLMQPFNAASLFCEMLQSRLPPQYLPLANNIQRSLEHAEELLTMLLDMTKLDAGNLQPDYQEFSIDRALQPLVERYQMMAKEKHLQLNYHKSSAMVQTDRKLLTRVVQNLLSNALRYTESGRIVLGFRRHQHHLTICIIDTGSGIPEHKQQDIFREFHQLQSSGDNPGLGLGLSIVERMCRLLKIDLSLSSTLGKGTLFELTLPVVSWHTPPEPVVIQNRSIDEKLLSGMRVLVIDNDPQVLVATAGLLSDWGADTLTAADLKQARQHPPCDLILADYHLDNGSTGIELVIAMRKVWGNDVPAIINSADPDEILREQALEANAHFIPKPLKSGALKRLLKRVRSI
ncbi:hybrid sensor histidine kinase/response regulator [Idiomarina sp. HP20-50]|uniref:PAS domain-containing hybrid sensor histidine kinase/response regulator n=1 Tax=Idiomarina sp. HP20-50 TaxID=3070813 RepID=UPI00294B72D8|nr:hybrid sensor histidine kinase/response regulator [Idiomarina sp. HP20-50]MDV6315656.1 hybrid sensor histidine kinase/response regulator [Idiomarina sp. HP20-50]